MYPSPQRRGRPRPPPRTRIKAFGGSVKVTPRAEVKYKNEKRNKINLDRRDTALDVSCTRHVPIIMVWFNIIKRFSPSFMYYVYRVIYLKRVSPSFFHLAIHLLKSRPLFFPENFDVGIKINSFIFFVEIYYFYRE